MAKRMSPLDIRIELMRRGITLKDIARRAGVSTPTVCKTIRGNSAYRGRRVRPYVAEALGLAVEDIWPDTESPRPPARHT